VDKPARYAAKPAPGILANSPKWVQDLFEAHFRSDLTLRLRREHNRMKLSRQDYAIGWLTLLSKIREDPSVLRLKDKGGAG
jgi:predicted component of type VI protein secretion system